MTHLVWSLYDGYIPEEHPDPPVPVEPRDEEEYVEVERATRRKCVGCKDPNFSLEKDHCIGCRVLPRY